MKLTDNTFINSSELERKASDFWKAKCINNVSEMHDAARIAGWLIVMISYYCRLSSQSLLEILRLAENRKSLLFFISWVPEALKMSL